MKQSATAARSSVLEDHTPPGRSNSGGGAELKPSTCGERSLLRLVRSHIGASRYDKTKRKLRQTSRLLASVRDAKVMLTTCQHLLQRRDPADRAVYSLPLRTRLIAARQNVLGACTYDESSAAFTQRVHEEWRKRH